MKLISTSDTLDFLSKTAPRPWVKRLLSWMICQGELELFATAGRITPKTTLFMIHDGFLNGEKTRAEINEEIERDYGDKVANSVRDAAPTDTVNDIVIEWNEDDEIQRVVPGVISVAETIDWESGLIITDVFYESILNHEHLFVEGDLFSSQFSKADYDVKFEGLCFSRDAVEMLSPGVDAILLDGRTTSKNAVVGRPRKWDWEGGIAYIVSVAQHPDGLPTGDGAQARIEDLLKDWFVAETGSSPAESQIRDRARIILRMVTPKRAGQPF